jgi:TolB-like protein
MSMGLARIYRRFLGLAAAALALISFSCVASPEARGELSLDEAIAATASRTVELIGRSEKRSLAVYYFTMGDEESALSDYIADSLTTELANRGGGLVDVLSRRAVDRILSEYSYQQSELVSRDEQVAVGRQLGADLILTGFLSERDSGEGVLRLNAQLIEVETARVLGGFVIDFLQASPRALGAAGASEVSRAQASYPSYTGIATVSTIYEDFESGIADMQLSAQEEHWGARIISASASSSIAKGDKGSYGRFDFQASFDQVDLASGWEDSDVGFYARIGTGRAPKDSDGLSIKLKSENSGLYYLFVKQDSGDEGVSFYQAVQLNAGEWRDLKLPFSAFIPEKPGSTLKPNLPLDLQFYLSFRENHALHYLREGLRVGASLCIDDVGLYKSKAKDPAELIEAFEDEINRIPFIFELYGANLYMDYSRDDDGVLVRNDTVLSQSVRLDIKAGGPAGGYLLASDALTTSASFPVGPLFAFLRGHAPLSLADYSGLSFLVRSNIGTRGSLEIQDEANDGYYSGEFSLMNTWSRVRLPFSALGIRPGTKISSHPRLIFAVELGAEELAKQARGGSLRIELGIDELRLYKD